MRFWCLWLLFCITAGANAAEPQIQVLFCGDIMLADNPGKEIAKGVDPFAEFKPLFQQADFVIGNLECVVATKGEPFDKPWTFRAHPHCVPLLKKHFHALSIANNHTGDFGREAFVEMLDLFKGEVPLFGGGRIKQAARQPLILEKHGLKLALLGYNGFKPRAFEATETEAGCAWLVEEEMLADIAAVKSNHKPDLILPYLHWGREGDREPQPYQQAMAKHLCEAGASAVIGAHPHVRQTIEIFNDKPVMYSLGNFVFDGFEGAPEAQTGWLWRLTLDRHGVVEWDTIVVRLEEKSGLPHLDLKTPAPSGKRGSSMIVEKTVSLK